MANIGEETCGVTTLLDAVMVHDAPTAAEVPSGEFDGQLAEHVALDCSGEPIPDTGCRCFGDVGKTVSSKPTTEESQALKQLDVGELPDAAGREKRAGIEIDAERLRGARGPQGLQEMHWPSLQVATGSSQSQSAVGQPRSAYRSNRAVRFFWSGVVVATATA